MNQENISSINKRIKTFFFSPKRLIFFTFTSIIFTVFIGINASRMHVFAAQGINQTINFQGKVVNSNGTNVADGDYSFTFTLYDAASGGSTLWTETQGTVHVTAGIFRVSLGSVSSLSSVDFNSDSIYLGINFNSDGEMTPRIRFASVPYAFNAQKVAGLTVTDTTGTLTIPNSKTVQFGGAFTTSAQDLTLTLSGTTTVTLPTTGTLATLAGSEILTNKTIGSTGLIFSGASTDLTTAINESLNLTPSGTGNVVINPSAGGQAALVVDKLGVNDIFTASAAGTTRFTVTNVGGIKLGTSEGTANQCLLSGGIGGASVWGSCDNNSAVNVFQSLNGAIVPNNITQDLLLGGTSTLSAKFMVLNMNNGTPTASVSAGATAAYLTGNGVLGTTALSQLSIGGPNTGNIVIDSQTGSIVFQDGVLINGPLAFQGSLTVEDGQFVGLGASAGRIVFTNSTTDEVGIQTANLNLNNNLITNIGNAGTDFTSGGGLTLAGALVVTGTGTFNGILDANGVVTLGDNGDTITIDSSDWDISSTGVGTGFDQWTVDNIDLNGQTISFASTAPSFVMSDAGTFTFTDGTNTLFSIVDRGTTGALVMPDGGVISIGGSGSSVAYNAFADSTAGAYTTDVNSDKDVYVQGNLEVDGTIRLNNQTLTFPSGAGTDGYLLKTDGGGNLSWIEVAGSIERWAETNNALHPLQDTWDFLVGGSSTSSAKFAFINVNSGTPTASIAGNLTLNSAGVIQTTLGQNMTIGGSDTGNIIVNPKNGQAGGYISPAIDNVTDLGASSSARFRDLYLGPNSVHVQCLTGDGCAQNLDYELGVDPATNGFYIGVNGNGASNKALSVREGGSVDVLGAFTSGLANAFQIDSTGNVTTSGTTGISLTGAGADINLNGAGSGIFFENLESIVNTTNGTLTFGRNDAGTVTITSADNDATAALSIISGGASTLSLDTGGAAAINIGTTNATSAVIGSASLGSLTVTTDGTGDSEVVLPTGSIGTSEILDDTLNFTDLSNSLSLDASTTITHGTSNLTLNLDGSGDFIIQDAGTAFAQFLDDGTITLGKSAAVSTFNIGVGTGIDTINIGTGTVGADVITIGNSVSTVSLVGTNINLTSAGVMTMSDQLVLSAVSGEGISGGGLTDCNGTTDKLQWDSATAQFSCGTDSSITAVFDAYDNTGGNNIGTGLTVNLDTVRKNSDGSTYSLSSDVLTINTSGTYTFQFRVGATLTAGTRGAIRAYMEQDTGGGFTEIQGSRAYAYGRITTYPEATAVGFFTMDVTAGDTFRVRAQVEAGTFSTVADGSSLIVTKVDGMDAGGGGGIAGIGIRESDGSPSVTDATTIEFGPATSSTDEFIVTDEGSSVGRIRLGTQVGLLNEAETVTAGWTFSTSATTFSSAATFSSNLYANGGIDTTANNNLSFTPNGTGDIVYNLDADTNAQFVSGIDSGVDLVSISNSSQGTTTNNVDGLQIDFATAAIIGARSNAGIQLNITSGATEVSDSLYGINIGNITGQTGSETAINIGTGWDSAIVTNNGNINAGTGTITASVWDGSGAVGMTIGSGDITSLTVTTDGTGDSEVALPAQSIGASEIVNNSITTAQLASTLTFSDGDYIDMSAIAHDDSTPQGLKLPQNTSLTSLASGEGYLAYNTTSNTVQVFDGANWVAIAGASTFDDIYAESVNQTDTTVGINDTLGLSFDLTTSGDFSVLDSGTAFVQFLDDGTITFGKASATGTINIGTGTAADTINIGSNNTTGDIINIGSSNASTSLSLHGGDYNDWYVEATGAAKFNTFAGAGLYASCNLSSSKIVWNGLTKKFECGNDNDSGGSPELQSILGATTDGAVRDSDNYSVFWNWDFTSAGVDAGINISESTASVNGTQDQQALLRISTLAGSTASPFQITSAGTDVADIYFDLTGAGDIEFRDSGTAFATFEDDSTISLGNGTSTVSINATNVGISSTGTLTLYGTTDITTDTNANLVILPNGTGDIVFQTDADSTFTIAGLTNCDTIDTDGTGKLTCGTDATGGGTGSLDDSYNNGGTVTVDAYDVLFNLNNSTNDYGIVIDASVDGLIDKALEITTTGGASAAFTTAIDVSDAGIVNALAVGDNTITGGSYLISASTALTLGAGSETIALNTSDWDISTTGDLTGIGTIAADGNITINKQSPTVIFDATTASDTDFWAGVISDAGNNDNDFFRIGKGTSPGTNTFLTLNTNGQVGINVLTPTELLDLGGNATVSGNLTFYGGARTIASRSNQTLQFGDAETGNIQFFSSSNILTSGGNLLLAGSITSSNWDGLGAVGLTVGSGDITSLTVTTDGTGDSEVVLPNESIGTTEITNDSLTPTDFASTLTFADGDFIDLSLVQHNDTALQGLRLPQGTSFSNPSSGEGFIAWDTTGSGELMVYNGSTWVGVGSSNFDDVYAQSVSDADVNMSITNGAGLIFDMTSSGNFSIQDGGTDIAVFGADGSLRLSPNNSSNFIIDVDSDSSVGIGTTTPLATLDIRGALSSSPVATVSGTTSAAGLSIDNNGTGDLLSISKTGATKFTVLNSGDVQVANLNASNCDVRADGTGLLFCGTEIGADGVTMNIFTSDGTWNAPSDLSFAQIIVTGGGGGGGEAETTDTAAEAAPGGGAAGGTTIEVLPAATLGSSQSVTIGQGGAGGTGAIGDDGDNGTGSSFGSLTAANGGGGGQGLSTGANGNGEAGGVGAAASSTGDINLPGGDGDEGHAAAEQAVGGMGGASYWGGGASGARSGGNFCTAGTDATVFGTGGGGAGCEDNIGAADGGDGADGVVAVMSYTSSGGDLAEWYETKDGVEAGDVVSISSESYEYNSKLGLQKSAILKKAIKGESVVGVVSSVPYETMGSDILAGAQHPKAIALAGRVPVKVSLENGQIKAGDLLGPSKVPGFAARSIKAGATIGRALDDSNCSDSGDICTVLAIVNSSYSTGALLKTALEDEGISLDAIPEGVDIGKILLAKTIQEKKNIVATEAAELYTDRVIAGLEVITPRLVADEVDASTLSVNTATISGTLTVDVLRANKIEGLEYLVNVASESAQNKIDTKLQSISDNQKLLEASMASISAKLDAMGNVNLLGLNSNDDQVDVVTVNNFASFGTTTLSEVSILNSLTIGSGSSLSISENSINVVGSDLAVQPLKQGGVSFLGGAIKFATDGSAVFEEDVEFRKNVLVSGVLSAQTVKATDLSFGQGIPTQISDDEYDATSAAGLITLKNGKLKVKVNNPLVKDNSYIFITPKTNTSRTLFLLDQIEAKDEEKAYFEVGIDRENGEDIKFNYLIVN